MTRSFEGEHVATPRYGENPQQESDGLFATPGNEDQLAVSRFELQEGAPPSYNNYADIDRLLQTATHIAAGLDKNLLPVTNIALGAKHGNMCGASIAYEQVAATQQTLDGDRVAIFGGSIMLNFALTENVADSLINHGMDDGQRRLLDVVTAPGINEGVIESLRRKAGKLRILTNPALAELGAGSLDTAERFRYVRGGFLVQQNYLSVPDFRDEEWLETNGETDFATERNLILAWGIGATSTSNTITLVRDGTLIGNGVGQQDRVSAARLAVERAKRAGHNTAGAVAYSDSFFPFEDGPKVLVDAGIRAVLTSSGSVKDKDVFKEFEKGGVRVFSAPDAKIRGFYGH